MKQKERAVVGYDSDDGVATLVIAIIVIVIALNIVIFGGAFIGGFYSIKNYFVSFKHNVIDENSRKVAA